MKKLILILLTVMLLPACGQDTENGREAVYMNITAEEAKQIMDSQEGYIILDVRTQEEYDEGHIDAEMGAYFILAAILVGLSLILYAQIKYNRGIF